MIGVVPVDNILFASEMHGAVRCADPDTGHFFDDTRRYIDAASHLCEEDRQEIYSGNALRLFKRLKLDCVRA